MKEIKSLGQLVKEYMDKADQEYEQRRRTIVMGYLTPEQFKDKLHQIIGMVKHECAFESIGDRTEAAKYSIRRNEILRQLERGYADVWDHLHNGKPGSF